MLHQHIPKILHQIWLGPKPRPQHWLDTWKASHPDWEYKLWNENNIPLLHNQKQFDTIQSYAGKADILRAELLYQHGGVYLDADSECLRPLDSSLLRYHFFACYENEKVRAGLIGNSAFGCEPYHPIMAMWIEAIHQLELEGTEQPWITLGPVLFTKVIRQYQALVKRVAILPSHAFYPEHYSGVTYTGRGKVYATQHWQTTYEDLALRDNTLKNNADERR